MFCIYEIWNGALKQIFELLTLWSPCRAGILQTLMPVLFPLISIYYWPIR